jgi:hypothetical protein
VGAVAAIQITRERRPWRDLLRRYRVLIDDQPVGLLRVDETVSFEVAPGRHVVRIKIDWTGSPSLALELQGTQTVRLRCRPAHGAWRSLIDMFGREGWVSLEVLQNHW